MSGWLPKHYLVLGGFLVVAAFVLSFLMVLGLLRSTLLVNFLAYGFSVGGFILGLVGTAMIMQINRHNDKK
ncbi:MAG TPA: hypothetical protein ENN32_07360 [Chloroflexi bacterium]|nr:hypothetical protein [Chloroflexota bacterium]